MPNRRPTPRPMPRNVAEYVLDLEDRAEDGEGDFEVPAEDWRELVSLATAAIPRLAFTDTSQLSEELLQLKALREIERQVLAKVLGVGVDTDWDELLEVAKGYAMALDAERERVVRKVADALADSRSKDNARTPLRCPRCLGPCLTEPKKTCVRAAGRTRYEELSKLDEQQRRELAADHHPNWFCQDRATGSECVLQEEHAGVCVTFDELVAEYAPEEPDHPECPTCGEADGHKPEDCALAEKPKKKRTSKKFPKGEGELEPCTKCGAPFGEHAGQKCPPKQRRMKITDVEPEAQAEAPF